MPDFALAASEPIPHAPTVLVVDDDEGTRKTMTAFLKLAGYRADCVDTGGAALDRVHCRPYAAIILDVRLPDIDGLGVLRRLRAAGVDTPVIMQSAFGDIPTAVEAMKLGAADFFSKGVSSDTELDTALRKAIERRHREGSRRADRHANPSNVLDAILGYIQHRKDCLRDETEPGLATSTLEHLHDELLSALCRTASMTALTIRQFLLCAAAVRHVVLAAGHPPRMTLDLLDVAGRLAAEAARTGDRDSDRTVEHAVSRLDPCSESAGVIRETDLAAALGLRAVDLGRLIERHTGVGFRELRRACRVRRAIRELVRTREHIGQIAYRVGLKHGSELDRDFHEMFALSPSEFRQLCRGLRRQPR